MSLSHLIVFQDSFFAKVGADIRERYGDECYGMVEDMLAEGKATVVNRIIQYQDAMDRVRSEGAELRRRHEEIQANIDLIHAERLWTMHERWRLRQEEIVLARNRKFQHVRQAVAVCALEYDGLYEQFDEGLEEGHAAEVELDKDMTAWEEKVAALAKLTDEKLKDALADMERLSRQVTQVLAAVVVTSE